MSCQNCDPLKLADHIVEHTMLGVGAVSAVDVEAAIVQDATAWVTSVASDDPLFLRVTPATGAQQWGIKTRESDGTTYSYVYFIGGP